MMLLWYFLFKAYMLMFSQCVNVFVTPIKNEQHFCPRLLQSWEENRAHHITKCLVRNRFNASQCGGVQKPTRYEMNPLHTVCCVRNYMREQVRHNVSDFIVNVAIRMLTVVSDCAVWYWLVITAWNDVFLTPTECFLCRNLTRNHNHKHSAVTTEHRKDSTSKTWSCNISNICRNIVNIYRFDL